MHFVKTENLVSAMRLARPMFDRRGQILFDVDSKINSDIIRAVTTAGLAGVYVLEPTEPLPPVSKEELELQRFQAMNSYALGGEIQELVKTRRIHRLEYITEDIIENFSTPRKRVNFVQDIRSKDDFIYKHSLNTAILAALIMGKLGSTMAEKKQCIHACLVHDIGKTLVPEKLLADETPDEIMRILNNSQDMGFELLDTIFGDDSDVKEICSQTYSILMRFRAGREQEKERVYQGTGIMLVAQVFEEMTAMDITGLDNQKSQVAAIRYLMKNPDIFSMRIVTALVDSLELLSPGTTVLLSNGSKALVASENPGKILYPMVLDLKTNRMIDLGNRDLFSDIEIVDTVSNLDNRYSMKN